MTDVTGPTLPASAATRASRPDQARRRAGWVATLVFPVVAVHLALVAGTVPLEPPIDVDMTAMGPADGYLLMSVVVLVPLLLLLTLPATVLAWTWSGRDGRQGRLALTAARWNLGWTAAVTGWFLWLMVVEPTPVGSPTHLLILVTAGAVPLIGAGAGVWVLGRAGATSGAGLGVR